MTEEQIRGLVLRMDTLDAVERDESWLESRELGERIVPYLAEAYPKMKKWQGRVACVVRSIGYARTSDAAFELGVAALRDRATLVRYRACMLLAYSLRKDAIPHLERLLTHKDDKTMEDACAAIDAIENGNHNYFIDRDHTGQIFWS